MRVGRDVHRAASNRDGTTSDTHAPFGEARQRSVGDVLSHVLPASFDTLTTPSSVPV